MKKYAVTLFFLLVYAISSLSTAWASDVIATADSEFSIATISLSTRKDATFIGRTNTEKTTISISSCWLEQKSGTKWVYACDLTPPDHISTNTKYYSALTDYSSKIGTGTYRIGATFCADGHAINRYSNERSF